MQIKYVCKVAQIGSVSDASKHLNISQSSILAAIDLAEKEANAKIFIRQKSKGVKITRAGEKFIKAANNILVAEQDFDIELNNLIIGSPKQIRIGCFEPFSVLFMPTIMRKFIEIVGDCEIVLFEGDHTQLRKWLAAGEIEIAIAYDIGVEIGENVTNICKVPAHAVLNTNDPLSKQDSVSIADLAQRPFVLLDLPETRTYLITLFDLVATRPKISFRTRSYDTVRGAVAMGFGVSILNLKPFETSGRDPEGLIRLPISDTLLPPTLTIIDSYGRKKPKYIVALIEIINQYFHEIGTDSYAVIDA